MDHLPAAVALLVGPDHVFEFANREYMRLVGGRPVAGRTVEQAFPEVREQGFLDLLDQVYATGEQVVGREVRATLLHEEGAEEIFVDFTYQPVHDAERSVEAILVHAVDVTAAVRSREQLAEALRREQEDRFRQAIDSMIDTVMIAAPVHDPDGRIVDLTVTFVNSGTDELRRRPREQLVGRRFTELWPNVEACGLLSQYVRVLETGEPLMLEDYRYSDLVEDRQLSAVFDLRATRLGGDLFLVYRDVSERVARERALAESRARLRQEHEAVATLQAAILPREVPAVPGAGVGAEYVAASENLEVGGDWFDVFALPNGHVALSVGDVAGKGIDAAGVMAQLRSASRVAALAGQSPDEVLASENALMIAVGLGPFATTVFGLYNPATGDLTWSSAGHLPPLHVSNGHAEYLASPEDPPLGVVEAPEYICQQIVLAPGDRLVLYTDGLIERRGESISEGLERLRRLVPSAGTAANACRALLEHLGVSDGPGDDICVLTLDRPVL